MKMCNIIASFVLFDREHKVEIERELSPDPELQHILKMVLDKLHEARDPAGNIIKQDKREKDNVFNSIIFKEISIDLPGRKMIIYKWHRLGKVDRRMNSIPFSEYGGFYVTKQII